MTAFAIGQVVTPSISPFAIRAETPADRAFILDSWRRSELTAKGVRRSRGARAPLSSEERIALHRFHQIHDAMTSAVLSRDTTDVLVACPSADSDTIAGYAIMRPPIAVLHKGPAQFTPREIGPAPIVYFVYIRPECRRIGLAWMLLATMVDRRDVIYTSLGDSSLPVPRPWQYMPQAAYVDLL